MTRIQRTALLLLAIFPLAAAHAAGQPPRRGGYPDRSRGSGSEPRYAFSLHSGYRALHIQSALFDDNEHDFGITGGDFLAARYGLEFDFTVLPPFDIMIGIESGGATTYGSYLDFTYEDGGEIEHQATLGLSEVTVGARFRIVRGPTRFRPYLLLGASGALYTYEELGEFVDFETEDIFYDEFVERSFLPGFFVGGGVDFELARRPGGGRIELFGEFRYARTEGEHDDDFIGFGFLELNRSGALLGFRFRF